MIKLIELFGKREFVKLLFFFLEHPTKKFTQKEVKDKLRLAKATLTKWLKELESKGLVSIEKKGVSKIYALERTEGIVKQLKIMNILLKLNKLKEIAKEHNIQIYLYGSSARGEDVEDSDIDLMVIGKVKKQDLIEDINKISDEIGRNIRFEIFSPMHWSRMSRKDKAFYERVEKDKILI